MKFNLTQKEINYYFDIKRDTIKENLLLQNAEFIPKYHKNWKSFKKAFYNQRHFNFTFIDRFYKGYHIHIDVDYAYKHFKNNTYNEYRQKLNATLLPTLTKPFLVVKDYQKNKTILTFYKPFKKKNNLIHITALSVEEQNNIFEYKTLYEVNHLGRIKNLFKKPINLIIHLSI